MDLEQSLWKVSDKFLSVTIDAGSIQTKTWDSINFTAPKVLNLAKALRPAMLRIGGTAQDSLLFQNTKSELTHNRLADIHRATNGGKLFYMTTDTWDKINQFAVDAGWDLIFGLNALLRNSPNGSWDSRNAQELFNYTLVKQYSVSWELGNGMKLRLH